MGLDPFSFVTSIGRDLMAGDTKMSPVTSGGGSDFVPFYGGDYRVDYNFGTASGSASLLPLIIVGLAGVFIIKKWGK